MAVFALLATGVTSNSRASSNAALAMPRDLPNERPWEQGSTARFAPDNVVSLSSSPLVGPMNFSLVLPEDIAFGIEDAKSVPWISGDPTMSGGFSLSNYPYAPSSAVMLGLQSGYPYQADVLDYGSGELRNLTINRSFSNGVPSPGSAIGIDNGSVTFLFSIPAYQGGGGIVDYLGSDLRWPMTGILDYPNFSNMSVLNMVIPTTNLGYPDGSALWENRGWTMEGTKLVGFSDVSIYIGSPPFARYVYVTDLTDPSFLDVTHPHDVIPFKAIPWDVPFGGGNYFDIGSNLLLHTTDSVTPDNYVFFDIGTDMWKGFTGDSGDLIWHGRSASYLYLLYWVNPSARDFTFHLDRIDLTNLTSLPTIASLPILTLLNATFFKNYPNYYITPIVRGDRLYFFEGSDGVPPASGPFLDQVTAYNATTGEFVLNQSFGLQLPPTGHSWTSQYPAPRPTWVYGSFLVDFDDRVIAAIDPRSMRTLLDGFLGGSSCGHCTHTVWVTGGNGTAARLVDYRADWDNMTGAIGATRILFHDHAPTASFDVSPGFGNSSTFFKTNSSGSTDPDQPPSTLEFRWSWEGDGVWDTDWSSSRTEQHRYSVEGAHTIALLARDALGAMNLTTRQVIMDATPPSVTILTPHGTVTTSSVEVQWSGTDAMSGIAGYELSVDGKPATDLGLRTSATVTLADGLHTIQVRAIDGAGNSATSDVQIVVDANVFAFPGPSLGVPTIALVIAFVASVVIAILLLRRRGRRSIGSNSLDREAPER